MRIKYEEDKIKIYNNAYSIELTKQEYKNFREEIRDVDMKLWMQEIPGMIREHQRNTKAKR
jgi:hypothetical protein